MATMMLKQMGYTLLPASTPCKAVQLPEANAGVIQLLLNGASIDIKKSDLGGACFYIFSQKQPHNGFTAFSLSPFWGQEETVFMGSNRATPYP
jgi:hypothetical protein